MHDTIFSISQHFAICIFLYEFCVPSPYLLWLDSTATRLPNQQLAFKLNWPAGFGQRNLDLIYSSRVELDNETKGSYQALAALVALLHTGRYNQGPSGF